MSYITITFIFCLLSLINNLTTTLALQSNANVNANTNSDDSHSSNKKRRNVRINANAGSPVVIYNPDYEVTGLSAEEKARNFIVNNLDLLHLNEMVDLDLSLEHVSTSSVNSMWTTVRYRQIYHGIPVYGSEIVITFHTNLNKVKMVVIIYQHEINLHEEIIQSPKQTESIIIQKTVHKYAHGDVGKLQTYTVPEKVAYYQHDSNQTILAWKMQFVDQTNYEEMEILFDDKTGDVALEKYLSGNNKNTKNAKATQNQNMASLTPLSDKKKQLREIKLKSNTYAQELLTKIAIAAIQTNHTETNTTLIGGLIQNVLDFITSPFDFLRPDINSTDPFISSSDAENATTPLGLFFPLINRPIQFVQSWIDFFNSLRQCTVSVFNVSSQCVFFVTEQPSSAPSTAPSAFYTVNPNTPVFGYVFDPDPISKSGRKYGELGFTDNSDSTNPVIERYMSIVNLLDVDYSWGLYALQGPYAAIIDSETPLNGLFEQKSPHFLFTRDQDAFEAVNCYYHIDTVMRYINEDLDIRVKPSLYSRGVRFDPHGGGGQADTSNYRTTVQELSFGLGGVDDAEDAEVIIHELGHGIHHWLTGSGVLNQNEGLSEGFSDYLAASYSRSKNLWKPEDPEYHWLFKWDGHNEFFEGRITNSNRRYPDDITADRYANGMIWSSCNMKIWDAIGREKSDKMHLIGLSATGSSSTQLDLANAIVLAATDLGYSESDITTIKTIYNECGYDV